MFQATGKSIAVVLTGDFWQLPPPTRDQPRIWESPRWARVRVVNLTQQWRCQCAVLAEKLGALRHARLMGRDGNRVLQHLCRGHKAWSGHHEPTTMDLHALFERTNGRTTIVTCTRRAAAIVNARSVQVLFTNRNQRPLGTIPADYECNSDNYDMQSNLREDRTPIPSTVQLFRGLRLVLTQNRDKMHHFVNGMTCTVEGFVYETQCLLVLTSTGKRLAVYPITDDHVPRGRVVYYPVRLGYANTVHKFQGAQLDHVTIWLDRAGCAPLSRRYIPMRHTTWQSCQVPRISQCTIWVAFFCDAACSFELPVPQPHGLHRHAVSSAITQSSSTTP